MRSYHLPSNRAAILAEPLSRCNSSTRDPIGVVSSGCVQHYCNSTGLHVVTFAANLAISCNPVGAERNRTQNARLLSTCCRRADSIAIGSGREQ